MKDDKKRETRGRQMTEEGGEALERTSEASEPAR